PVLKVQHLFCRREAIFRLAETSTPPELPPEATWRLFLWEGVRLIPCREIFRALPTSQLTHRQSTGEPVRSLYPLRERSLWVICPLKVAAAVLGLVPLMPMVVQY